MADEPSKEELQEKIANMEKQYDEIIEKMEERYSQDLANILKRMKNDPVVICTSCGCDIKLDPIAYWKVKDTDIKCEECGALMRITLQNGELKKSQLMKAGESDRK